MADDSNGLDEPTFTTDPNSDEAVSKKDLEIAFLRLHNRIKTHVTDEIKEVKKCTNERFDKLPCPKHHDEIKKNSANHRTLVIVLVTTGVLGGGSAGYGIARLVSFLTTAGG